MKVPLVRLCAVLLLSSFPMVCGANNFGGKRKVGDMATDESGLQVDVTLIGSHENAEGLPHEENDDCDQLTDIAIKTDRIFEFVEQQQMSCLEDDVMTRLHHIEDSIQSSDQKATELHSLVMNQHQEITDLLSAIKNQEKFHGCNNQLNDGKTNQCLEEIFKFVKEIHGQMFDKSCRQEQGVSFDNRNSGLNNMNRSHMNRRKMMHKQRTTPYQPYTSDAENERCQSTHRMVKRAVNPSVFFEPNKRNCHEIRNRRNGIYKFASEDVVINEAVRFFYERYCDFDTVGAAWTVIQRRHINNKQGRGKFNRKLLDYKLGFGEFNKEFWSGNDFIHNLTSDYDMELRIVLEDTNGSNYWAEYSSFKVGSEEFNYNFTIGDYRGGSIPDKFLRLNKNNGHWPSYAHSESNGWRLNNCTDASNPDYEGIIWRKWLRSKCLTLTTMMVRPANIE